LHEIEWPFTRDGKDVVPGFGFRVRDKPAKTILDHPDKDEGIFTGVAFYVEGLGIVLAQLLAGWNWYVSAWRFHVDGTLKLRFGFGETGSYVCDMHRHHVYWRFDFDIVSLGNNLVGEFNKPPIFDKAYYHNKIYQIRRLEDP
jgi:hypothetical protein